MLFRSAEKTAEIEAKQQDPLYKARKELIEQQTEATKALKETREGLKNRLPAGTSTPVFDEVESSSSPDVTIVEPDLPKWDDYAEPNSEISAATTYPSSVEMEKRIESQAPSLQYLSPESVTASTDAFGPIVSPVSFSIQDIKAAPLVSEQQAQEAEQATAASRKALEAIKPPTEAPKKSKFTPQPVKDFRTQQAANEYASTDFEGYEVGTPQEMRDPQGGTFYRVISKKYSPAEIAKQKREQAESESRIAARKQYEGQKQERLYQQYVTAAQNEPSVKTLEDPKFGMSKFTAEIPEFYQQYKDYLAEAEKARQKGDTKSEVYNRRMVAETVNAIIDSFARLASGKAVTEGQLTMIKKESIDPLQQFTKNIDSWLKGGVIAPDEQVRSIAKIAT